MEGGESTAGGCEGRRRLQNGESKEVRPWMKTEKSEGKEVRPWMKVESADDEPFLCFICLQLLYKPVVNACGHTFCFWCIQQAMSTDTESYCPLCRRAYMHFPRVCEQLHFLLLKAVPAAYRRRCREVYLEEPFRSPQFDDGLDFGSSSSSAAVPLEIASSSASETLDVLTEEREEDVDLQATTDKRNGDVVAGDAKRCEATVLASLSSSRAVGGDDAKVSFSSSPPSVTVSDLLCNACKKLLHRPAVVNCGHVFCEECLAGAAADGATLKCVTCGSVHPGGYPRVCLELHQYLEQNFPKEYEERARELARAAEAPGAQKATQSLKTDAQAADAAGKAGKSTALRPSPWMHGGIGCDGCGMFPLLGRRFKCMDCPAIPGYDLCWHCYQNGTSLLGRFNQQHTQEHHVRELPSTFHNAFADIGGEGSESMEAYFGIVGYFA